MATSKSRQLGKEEMLVGTGLPCSEASPLNLAGGHLQRAPKADQTSSRHSGLFYAPLGGGSS